MTQEVVPMKPLDPVHAVCLLSGGQDSVTCLYWALREYGPGAVAAISFDYGQRHKIELQLAAWHTKNNNVPHLTVPVPALSIFGAASLTNDAISNQGDGRERNRYADEHGLPQSFVPGRNAIFLTTAAAYAAMLGADSLVGGMCQQDSAGYPDCRADFVYYQGRALEHALDNRFLHIVTPLMERSKAETWQLADDLGIVEKIVVQTSTCYEGDRTKLHAWGYGCDECGACQERRKGFEKWQALRPEVVA